MRSGVDGYVVAPDLGRLAAVTREAAQGVPVAALTAGGPSAERWELEGHDDRRSRAVLRLAVSPGSGLGPQPRCFVLDVEGWLRQFHPEGAEPEDRLRCTELAWTTALQLLEGGLDVAVSGVDHEVWRWRAHQSGIEVVDEQ